MYAHVHVLEHLCVNRHTCISALVLKVYRVPRIRIITMLFHCICARHRRRTELSSGNSSPISMDAFSAPSLLSTPIAMSPRHGGGAHPHLKGELAGDGVDATTCFGSYNDEQFEGVDCLELVEQLADTESLHEQADIIHYLFVKKCVLVRRT